MRLASRNIALALPLLLAVCLAVEATSGGSAATATPGATPSAACAHRATPTSARGTPVPVEELTAADIAKITNAVTVRMTEHGFDPRAFSYAVGHEVEVTLINTDSCEHTFTIDNLDIDVVVPPGATRKVTVSAHYGEHPFHSRAPGDTGLEWTGLLRVYL